MMDRTKAHNLVTAAQHLVRAIESAPQALALLDTGIIARLKEAILALEIPTPPKRILIEITGAEFDGRTLDSYSPDPTEQYMVYLLMHCTKQGEVGQSFEGVPLTFMEAAATGEVDGSRTWFKSPGDGKTNKYTVKERLDDDDAILVRIFHSVADCTE